MNKFIKKLSYYDGSKFLKRAMSEKLSFAEDKSLSNFKDNWNTVSSIALSSISNLQSKLQSAAKSVKEETGGWGWITGTNEAYRKAAHYLEESNDSCGYLYTLISRITEYVKSAESMSGLYNLTYQSTTIMQTYQSIDNNMGVLGDGEISGNSDITEYIYPAQQELRNLNNTCQQLSAILNTLSSTQPKPAAAQAPSATEPQQPSAPPGTESTRTREWDPRIYEDEEGKVYRDSSDAMDWEETRYYTKGNVDFNKKIEDIKRAIGFIGPDYLNNPKTSPKDRVIAFDKYNQNWQQVANQLKPIIAERKRYLESLKREGKLDPEAFRILMEQAQWQEDNIPKGPIKLEDYGYDSKTGKPLPKQEEGNVDLTGAANAALRAVQRFAPISPPES